MENPPKILVDHLEAITTDPQRLRTIWAPDGVLEFPYARSLGLRDRLVGIEELVAYFGPPRRFRDWSFDRFRTMTSVSGGTFAVEFTGTAVHLETGRPYEQEYVMIVELAAHGRITHLREYWDPTRVPAPD
jgi:ketosteroid isomerase-like protein